MNPGCRSKSPWAPSGHLANFDRRKCKGPLNGPTATGQQCPEGWTLYPEPLPQFQGVSDSGSAESSYYTWVDQFGALGLGPNVPIDTGNESEGLLVLKDSKWIVLRVKTWLPSAPRADLSTLHFEFTNHRGRFFGQPLRVISGEPPVPFLGFDDVNGMY